MTRARRAAAALVLCTLGCTGLAAPSGAAADAGGIGVVPAAQGGVDPVSNGFLVETTAPGATVSGAVVVTNSTATTTPVSVYAADGITAVTTGVSYADGSQPPQSAGAWVTPAVTSLDLAPDSSQTVDFTVQVPAGATPGDHVAGIVVQQAATPGGGSVSISQVVRGVVPLDVQVSGAAGEQAQLGAPTLATVPGTTLPTVLVPIEDAGALMCRPTLTVTVASSTGASSSVTRQLDLLLPGDSITYSFSWPSALPPGTYDITTEVSGCGTAASTHATATIGGGSAVAGNVPQGGATAGTGSTAGPPSTAAEQPKPSGPAAPTATHRSTPTAAPPHTVSPPAQGNSPSPSPAVVSPRALSGSPSPAVQSPPARHRHQRTRPGSSGLRAGTAPSLSPHPAIAVGRGAPRRRAPATGPLAAILRTARTVLTTSAFPLAMLIVMVLFILLQDGIDRRDPKLSLASAYADPELSFGPTPAAVPDPSGA